MTVFTYFDAIGEGASALAHFHPNTLVFTGPKMATGFEVVDSRGISVQIAGSGLTYDGDAFPVGGISGGSATAITFRDAQGHVLLTLTGFSVDATLIDAKLFNASGNIFLKGRDTLNGSGVGDFLASGKGNDVLNGGAGNDLILGGTGSDTMRGDGGADSFIFALRDKGQDRITDFHDTGVLATDDRIGCSQAMYDSMTATQSASGVTLHFGSAETVLVVGWTLAQIGLDDFALSG